MSYVWFENPQGSGRDTILLESELSLFGFVFDSILIILEKLFFRIKQKIILFNLGRNHRKKFELFCFRFLIHEANFNVWMGRRLEKI